MSDTSPALPRLTASEAAARLGVKPQTLYAYVSRGLLTRIRDRTGSSFDALEVEAFAARRRPATTGAQRSGRPAGSPLGTIDVDLALIEDDELYYRGRRAAELTGRGFEAVCRWVWSAELGSAECGSVDVRPAEFGSAGFEANEPVGVDESFAALDRIHLAVVAAGAGDPFRNDLDPRRIVGRAGPLLATQVAALPLLGPAPGPAAGLAEQLWPRLTARPATPASVGVLEAALVLLLDHDLAASTMAVRVAASARAHPYAAVAAGLGALDSALHGDVSRSAHRLLGRVIAGEPVRRVLAETVGSGGPPGFGHRIYRERDPRAERLVELLDGLTGRRSGADLTGCPGTGGPYAPTGAALSAYRSLVEVVRAANPRWFPNIDLALATMAHAFGMGADAGTAVFAIGRTAGWIAHLLAEYREPALRLRPVGRYRGP